MFLAKAGSHLTSMFPRPKGRGYAKKIRNLKSAIRNFDFR
jgi:hypothetical protein